MLHVVSSQPLSKAEKKALQFAYHHNLRFFAANSFAARVIVCHSADEWKKASQYYFFEFARGVVLRDGTVVLKSPQLAKRSHALWTKIAVHEFNHAVWCLMHKSRKRREIWTPIWLVEGLACFVARNDIILSKRETLRQLRRSDINDWLPYRYRATLFPNSEMVRLYYSVWYYFVCWLDGCYGEQLAALIEEMPKVRGKHDIQSKVRSCFKKELDDLFSEWLLTHKA